MSDPRLGLVLGGGGARGVGHVVVLEAMDELGLQPAAIAGCSIGAIIGAARANGLTGREIRERVLATFKDSKSALGVLWELRPRSFKDMFTGRLGQFDPERVLETFVGPYIPDTFEALKIPFSVVASDFYNARSVVFRSGPLKPAVAASMALPTIFKPITDGGRVLMDGGITNPVPVDELPQDVTTIIAVDVVALPEQRDGQEIPGSMEATLGALQLLMASLADAKFTLRPPDLLYRPPVARFHVLDFLKARDILIACDAEKDELKRRIARIVETQVLPTMPVAALPPPV